MTKSHAKGEGAPREGDDAAFADAVCRNVALAREQSLCADRARIAGVVSGTREAQRYWELRLGGAEALLGARSIVSLHEDLPVNQALGILLSWQRLRPELRGVEGCLMAFAIGDGSRAAPITEAECGQKPAITSFVPSPLTGARLTVLEAALWSFAPVEAYLRRSGFSGLVVKWGDEIQIPERDLRGSDPRFAGADIVRFVSIREMNADNAANKDWVAIDPDGNVTGFLPRRSLAEMQPLGDAGILHRRDGRLFGGINLGSIALSRGLLDLLLDEFSQEVNDPTGERSERPDLDPQFFTALCVACIDDAKQRADAWQRARADNPAVARLDVMLPGAFERMERVIARFRSAHGRRPKLVAFDLGEIYWGDIGQHGQMYDYYHALAEVSARGRIVRALAGLPETRDARGNILVNSTLGSEVDVRGSVLIDARIDSGRIEDCVLIGTHARRLDGEKSFDIESRVGALSLGVRSGAYKVVTADAMAVGPGERVTTVFVAEADYRMRVAEMTDLRNRSQNYDAPILGNPISFRELHRLVRAEDPMAADRRRAKAIAEQSDRREPAVG